MCEFEIIECGKKPDLTEASLHGRNSGTASVESQDTVCIVAIEEETLSPKAISPELESYHDSEELNGVDVVFEVHSRTVSGNGVWKKNPERKRQHLLGKCWWTGMTGQ